MHGLQGARRYIAAALILSAFLSAFVVGQPGVQMFHPQLLEGAWAANAPRLSELVADYELISDLAVTYGRIEELRWRLRYRSENLGARDLIDGMTLPLVVELDSEITNLVQRVEKQIQSPAAQPLGLAHFGKIESTLTMTSTLEAALIPGTPPATTAEPPADDADG